MKTIKGLERIILFSIYALAFFLPISKALIESFSILAIVCFVIKKIIQRQNIPKTHINFTIFSYLVICFLSIFMSSNPGISTRTFFAKIIQNVLLFFVLADTLNNERRIRHLLYIFFASALLLGIDGIYQYFTGNDFIRSRLYREFGSRITATFRSPNGFGCYLLTIISFLIPSLFIKIRFKVFKAAFLGLLILLTICLVFTFSKGAWFAFLSSILFLSFWFTAVPTTFLIIMLLIIALHLFYPQIITNIIPSLSSVFSDLDVNAGVVHRKIMWRTGWSMFMSSPWIGVGVGTFMFNFQRFLTDSYEYGPAYAHNCYLQMAAETGIIGLLSFLAILFLFFYHGIRILKRKEKNFFWYILIGSLSAMLGYCVQMGVDTTFYALDLGILFWIILGLGIALMRNIELQ